MQTHSERAYVGTYTDGLYEVRLGRSEGESPGRVRRVEVGDSPSFLDVHPNESSLYAVHEVSTGSASTLRIDEDGAIRPANRVETGAGAPCHCSVHPSGEWLLVAHYTGGAVSVLPITDGGELGEPTDVVAHDGSSVDPERQNAPHPHSITPGPNGRFAYVPDLGTDEVVVYELADGGTLERASTVDVAPGAGPRHLDFHPSGEFAFLITELDSTVVTFRWDAETGGLEQVDTVSTLPADWDDENYPADVHVHPSGRWVYGSNRGHDSIVVFDVDERTGELDAVDHESTRGEWPRHFTLDPSGEYLFAANQHSDSIVAFRVDGETGALTATGEELEIPEPVCTRFRRRG